MIVINPPGKKAGKEADLLTMDLEKTLDKCKKVEFIKGSKINQYILEFPEGSEYKSVKVSFYNKTFFLQKLEFFYSQPMSLENNVKGAKEKPKLVVTYNNIDTNPKAEDSLFNYSSYLKKVNGKFELLENYKKYAFINQLENK
jgi:hypothetical protein